MPDTSLSPSTSREALILTVRGPSCEAALLRPDGALAEARPVALPALYLPPRVSLLGRLFEGQKRLVWLLARLVYMFPVLLVLKLALYAFDWQIGTVLVGDLITLAWVALLLVFFPMLALFVLLFVLAGPKSRRHGARVLAPPSHLSLDEAAKTLGLAAPAPSERAALQALAASEPSENWIHVQAPIRVTGTLRRFAAGDEPLLLRDRWFDLGDRVVRVLEAEPMVVEPDPSPDGALAPIVIDPGGPPSVIAPYAHHPAAPPAALATGDAKVVSAFERVLRDGDRVELLAFTVEPVVELREMIVHGRSYKEPPELAYRGENHRALRARATVDAPVILRVLGD